jgi:post-segregation antitoxin (ccd killing protein)
VSVDDLITVAGRAVTILREAADDARALGLNKRAALVESVAERLEKSVATALTPDPEESRPGFGWIDSLLTAIKGRTGLQPAYVTEFLATRLKTAQRLLRKAQGPAEITGDAELMGEMQTLVDDIDEGPSRER